MSLLPLQFRDISRAKVGILFAFLLTYALAPAVHAQQPGTAVIFYAQPQLNDALWPDLLQSLHADLAAGLGEAPNGFALPQDPAFFRANDLALGVVFSRVIVVKLLGRCDVLRQSDSPSVNGPLGWVWQVSGKMQPFIYVDCERLAQMLCSRSASLDQYERRHAMAQAIAHVVIHEWIHIATQSPAHGKRGITKQFLTAAELTGEPKNNMASVSH
jgi:hypothetical protein